MFITYLKIPLMRILEERKTTLDNEIKSQTFMLIIIKTLVIYEKGKYRSCFLSD
jgi:hypothetical protein